MPDDPLLTDINEAIRSIPEGFKGASGTTMSTISHVAVVNYSGSTTNIPAVVFNMSALDFIPEVIELYKA